MKSACVRRNRSRYSSLLCCSASSNWVNRATCSVWSGSAFCWGSSASPSCASCCITSIPFQNLTALLLLLMGCIQGAILRLFTGPFQSSSLFLSTELSLSRFLHLLLEYHYMPANLDDITS